MKKVLSLLFSLFPLLAFAWSFESGGITYETDYYGYSYQTPTASVTKRAEGEYVGVITIPAEVIYENVTYSVTGIRANAFSDCSNLTSLTIPNTVSYVGDNSFNGCTKLSKLIIEDGDTKIILGKQDNKPDPVHHYNLFHDCPIETLYLGRNVGLNGYDSYYGGTQGHGTAFEFNNSLINLKIGNHVTDLPNYIFNRCSGLTTVQIPSSIKSIGKYAFGGCNLSSIIIPNSVSYLGKGAFSGNSSLSSVTISNNLTSIEDRTFNGCYSLNNLTIPNSVKRIGEDAFYNHLPSLTIPQNVDWEYKYIYVKELNINITDWSLDNIAIDKPYDLYKNTSVKYFYDGVELSEVVIPDTVSVIGNNLLVRATNITSIHIPSNVQSIGNYAFAYCDNLATVTFETNNLSIGSQALYECPNLSSVNVNITDWASDAFGNLEFNSDCIYYSNGRKLSDVVVPDSVTTIGKGLFVRGQNIRSVTMHDNVISIGEGAFRDCKNLTSATISNRVTSISDYAFSGTGLTSIDLPNSVTKIGRYAFKKCPELKTIKMPNSVTNIGSEAFYGCSSLSSIDMPNSVTTIGSWAFYGCTNLTKLSFASQITKAEIYASQCRNLSSIIVNITDWSGNNNIDSDICIDYYTNGEKMVDVVIPDSATSIGNYALFGGKEIKSITLPQSITSIGRGAFGQLSLSSVQVSWPEPLDIKKDNVFYESDLSSCTLYVPKGMKSLYAEADIWKDFGTIDEAGDEGEPENKQCAAPTISFEDGKIMLSCETEGVEFVSVLTENCAKEYNTNIISLTPTYTISVYATKTGYTNSEVVTKEIPLSFDCIEGDMNNDGKVSVADVSKLVSKILSQEMK